MKISKYYRFAALIPALMLGMSSCSDSAPEGPDASEDQGISDSNQSQTITFEITNASDNLLRRAPEDDELFVKGDGNESKIDNVTLLFYNGDAFFNAVEPTFSEATSSGLVHSQEKVLKAQVTLKEINGKRPTHVFCVINGRGLKMKFGESGNEIVFNEINLCITQPSRADIISAINNYEVEVETSPDGKITPSAPMLMTNSVYMVSETNPEDVTTADKVYDFTVIPPAAFITTDDTRDPATVPVVHIDVERVNARVDIISKLNEPNAIEETVINFNDVDVTTDINTEMTVVPEIQSIQLAQHPKKSFFIKSLEGNESYSVMDWKSVMYPRCYWATSPLYAKWNDYDESGNFLDGDSDYNYKSFNQMGTEDILTWYPQENTSDQPTCVIISAILKNKATGETIQDMIDVNGTRKYFMSMDNYKKYVSTQLAKQGLKYTYVDDDGVNVKTDDWAEFVSLKRSENPVDKSFDVKAYIVPDGNKLHEGNEAKAANDFLKSLPAVLYYNGGMCYFYVEITHDLFEQLPDEEDLTKAKGVVRNHAYQVTLRSLKGIGSPIYDPDEEIIPNRPEEVIEIKADIHPLKWKLVKQEADVQ